MTRPVCLNNFIATIKNQWPDVSCIKIKVKVTIFFNDFCIQVTIYMALAQLYLGLFFTT